MTKTEFSIQILEHNYIIYLLSLLWVVSMTSKSPHIAVIFSVN